jgi:hypothetical protein
VKNELISVKNIDNFLMIVVKRFNWKESSSMIWQKILNTLVFLIVYLSIKLDYTDLLIVRQEYGVFIGRTDFS